MIVHLPALVMVAWAIAITACPAGALAVTGFVVVSVVTAVVEATCKIKEHRHGC